MKVLVTGHIGFVGSNFTALTHKLYDLTGVDIRASHDDTSRVGLDLANEDIARGVVEKVQPDAVVHLASSVSTPGSIERPLQTFRDTVRTAVNVLEACRPTKTPVLLTSSVKARDGMTPYGASKRMAETWAQEYADCYDLPVIINRPGTIYGPGQEGSPESGWIAWFLKAKEEGIRVTVNGEGDQIRDLLHVQDYVKLLVQQLSDIDRYTGRVWDVGGGAMNAVSVEKMVEWLKLDHTHGPRRYGDAQTYVGENDVPGWEPEINWKDSGYF